MKPTLNNVPLEEALVIVGRGKFQIWVTLVGGFCFLAAGFQNSLNAYILPSVRCDMGISSSHMGLLNAGFLAGGLTSGFLWGALVDVIGRWPILVFGMLLDGIFTVIAATSQSFYFLLIFRILSGFVVGGPAAIVLAYIGEFHSVKVRNQVICYAGLFWTASWVILPGVAWVIVPIKWQFILKGFKLNSWRILVALVSLPSLSSALLLSCLPESPKYLLARGHPEKALKVITDIYLKNTGLPASSFPIKSLERPAAMSEMKINCKNKSVWRPLVVMLKQFKQLFVGPTLPTIALTSFLFFSNMFGYYGLGLWLPELVNRFEVHEKNNPNVTLSVCELSDIKDANGTCGEGSVISPTVFVHSLVMGVVALTGNVASGILANRLSRPTLPVFLMLTSALCVLTLYKVRNSVQNLIVSAVFQLCIGTSNMVYNALVVDMFPNEISGLAVCLSIMSGRLGAMISNLVFGHLLDYSCSIPIFLCSIVIACGGLLSFAIPKEPYEEQKQKERKAVTVA